MARLMLSIGMFTERALSIARRSRKFASGSPPPARAATMISRATFVNTAPRFASLAPFWRLIVDHLECPDIARSIREGTSRTASAEPPDYDGRTRFDRAG